MDGIYLLLGSNLGDKRKTLNQAIKQIKLLGSIISKSMIYETAAWGKTDQPSFYNQVLELRSKLEPEELLSKLQNIEIQLGRERFEKWGSRTIDIDILYFGDLNFKNKNLSIPHPQIQNRRFTLVPLNEIAPDFIHPTLKKSQSDLLHECEDGLEVIKTQWN